MVVTSVLFFFGKPTYVFLVHEDEVIGYQRPNHELRIGLFRDQILRCEIRIGNVNPNDLLSGRVLVGHQIEERAVVSDASDTEKPRLAFRVREIRRMKGTNTS